MSLGGGLFSLAQSLGRPAQLSPEQQGLFDGLAKALDPQSQMSLDDPTSIRAAAEKQANSGNTVEAQRLLKIAEAQDQKIQQGQVQNIARTYAMMEKAGREKEFEDTMIAAGKADVIGAIKQKRMQEEMLAMEYGDVQRSRKVRELTAGYFGAQTEEGRKIALDRMREEGFGLEAQQLKAKAAEARAEAIDVQLRQSKAEWDQAVQQIKALPVPTTQDGITRVRSSIPEQMRGIYDQQVTAVMNNRTDLVKAQDAIRNNEPFSRELVEKMGEDYDQYISMYRGGGGGKVNETYRNKWLNSIKQDASTMMTEGQYQQMSTLFDTMNELTWGNDEENRTFGRGDIGSLFYDKIPEAKKEEAVQLAWDISRKRGVGSREAMDAALLVIAEEMDRLAAEE